MRYLLARNVDDKLMDEIDELLPKMKASRGVRTTKNKFMIEAIEAYVKAWKRRLGL